MEIQNLSSEMTIIGGRPGAGKSTAARLIIEHLIRQKKRTIYYHAEGPVDLHEANFDFLGPDDMSFLDYIPDIFTTKEDLIVRMSSFSKSDESLTVVDTIELFDCEPRDLIQSLRRAISGTPAKVLILANFPRKFELTPRDCAEEFLRRKFALVDEAVIILGDFPAD